MNIALATAVSTGARMLRSGTGIVLVTVGTVTLVRLLSTVLLTRLLAPADFGVAGVMAMLTITMKTVTDFGFGIYIVQHRSGADPRLLDILWTARLVRSALLTLVVGLLAAPIALLIGKPELGAAIAVTSLHFIIDGLASLALLTAVRDQRLSKVNLLEVLTTLFQTGAGIALAVLLRDYWAILLSGLAGTALRTGLSYTMFPGARRRIAFDRAQIADFLKFGRMILGGDLIQMLVSQADKIVLSRLLPLSGFGLYNLASNLAAAPAPFTSAYPHQILLPAYAKAYQHDPDQLSRIYYDKRRIVSLLYMGAIGLFIGLSPVIVELLYDDRYADAAHYLQLLALAPLFALGNYAAREVLIVVGRVKAFFLANLIRICWLGVAGTAGYLAFGQLGLVAAVGTVEIPVLAYNWWELDRHRLLRFNEELFAIQAGCAGIAVGYAADRAIMMMMH